MTTLITLIVAAVTFGTVLMYGTLGEILTEKSGNLNLGVEGIMYMGGAFGLAGAFYYEKAAAAAASGPVAIVIAILSAFAAGMAASAIYSFITVTLRANQNVTGLALSIFGTGIGQFVGEYMRVSEGGYVALGNNLKESFSASIFPDALVSIPVIGAGGIADEREAAASFILGAEGIQMGTAFLAAKECNIHPVYKEKIIKAGDRATMVTGKRLGHPVRSLRTSFARRYREAEYSSASDEELEKLGVGALRKAVKDGDEENGCFLSGQAAYYVNEIKSAKDIVEEIMKGCERIMREGFSKWLE